MNLKQVNRNVIIIIFSLKYRKQLSHMCMPCTQLRQNEHSNREREETEKKKNNDNTEFTQLEWIVDNIKLIDFEKHAVDSTCVGVFSSMFYW